MMRYGNAIASGAWLVVESATRRGFQQSAAGAGHSARRQRRQLEPPAAVRADQELREKPNGPGGMGKSRQADPRGIPMNRIDGLD
jgi:hypothetical protein